MERSNSPQPPESGFRASLASASLPEFIQIGGAGGGRIIYRVSSGGRSGYLYFDAGHVVHAHTDRASGQDAAFEILQWDHGTIEAWPGPWPRAHTFSTTPQALLLQAAYREDEDRRHGALIPFERHRKPMHDPAFETLIHQPTISAGVLLDRDGGIVVGKGGDLEELGALASYAAMLAELVGESLGLEGFAGFDARIGEEDCAMRKTSTGLTVTLGARGTAGGQPWEELP